MLLKMFPEHDFTVPFEDNSLDKPSFTRDDDESYRKMMEIQSTGQISDKTIETLVEIYSAMLVSDGLVRQNFQPAASPSNDDEQRKLTLPEEEKLNRLINTYSAMKQNGTETPLELHSVAFLKAMNFDVHDKTTLTKEQLHLLIFLHQFNLKDCSLLYVTPSPLFANAMTEGEITTIEPPEGWNTNEDIIEQPEEWNTNEEVITIEPPEEWNPVITIEPPEEWNSNTINEEDIIKQREECVKNREENRWTLFRTSLKKHVAASYIAKYLKRRFPTTEELRHHMWKPKGYLSRKICRSLDTMKMENCDREMVEVQR
jgi:hypothetical protein